MDHWGSGKGVCHCLTAHRNDAVHAKDDTVGTFWVCTVLADKLWGNGALWLRATCWYDRSWRGWKHTHHCGSRDLLHRTRHIANIDSRLRCGTEAQTHHSQQCPTFPLTACERASGGRGGRDT